MAQRIAFTPKSVDPRLELQRRLDAAPTEHAEALLAAYALLEDAHRQGILDTLHGVVGAKDTIVGLVAKHAAMPESVAALRNLLALGAMLGTLDPQPISALSKQMQAAFQTHQREEQPPSLWQIFKRVRHPQARRGLSLLTRLLAALGSAAE